MANIRHPGEELFFEAIMMLKSQEECSDFFADICTIKEIQAMIQRLKVACLLDAGYNYLQVSEATGASSATISRVNRCLTYGTGYRAMLDKMKESGVIRNDAGDLEG